MTKDLATLPKERPTRIDRSEVLHVGHWYWVEDPDDTEHPRWLGCLVAIGSNFFELEGLSSEYSGSTMSTRIHTDDLTIRLTYEPQANQILTDKAKEYQAEAGRLMEEVKALTMRLGVSTQTRLGDSPTQEDASSTALVAVTGQTDVLAYKKDLIEANKTTLPNLFKGIQSAMEMSAHWMKGTLIPLKAQTEALRETTKSIEGRIFNVELYAGLTETVVQVRDGATAPYHERLRLMQRKCYMDEECVAGYMLGGISIESLKDFDKWLIHPDNFQRLLPFPRCMIAVQIRREAKERAWRGDLHQLFVNFKLGELDKSTFLYIRNGEQVFRLETSLEFGALIFPDRGEFDPRQPLMAKKDFSEWEIITRGDWEEQKAKKEAKDKARAQWFEENPFDTWKLTRIAEKVAKGRTQEEAENSVSEWDWENANPHGREWHNPFERGWHPVDPSSVYYDDVMRVIRGRIEQYNRIALILQGLYDRSPIMHPHPPVRLAEAASFASAVELIYDSDCALYPSGEPPDYEAYRSRLAQSIRVGSLVVGAHQAYLKVDEERAEARFNRSYHSGSSRFYYNGLREGDPGPGLISRVVRLKKGGTVAVFEWERTALDRNNWPLRGREPVLARVEVEVKELLHVDAYQPGDWKQFFQDPRTRERYLQWAPILLAAEEYKAGRLKVGQEPPRHIWSQDDD